MAKKTDKNKPKHTDVKPLPIVTKSHNNTLILTTDTEKMFCVIDKEDLIAFTNQENAMITEREYVNNVPRLSPRGRVCTQTEIHNMNLRDLDGKLIFEIGPQCYISRETTVTQYVAPVKDEE